MLLLGWLPARKAQQDTCNESWMVDFSLSTLICDADEPEAHPSPPNTRAHTHSLPLYLWMGSLKGEKDQVQISRADISNGAVVSIESGGRGIIMSILMQNREVRGYDQLFVGGGGGGGKTSGDR